MKRAEPVTRIFIAGDGSIGSIGSGHGTWNPS